MLYGTLIDGQLVHAPNPVHINGMAIYNPSDSTYESMGYLPIIDNPMPDQQDGYDPVYYTSHWEKNDGKIVRTWEQTNPPEPEPVIPTTEERLCALETTTDDLVLMMADLIGGN